MGEKWSSLTVWTTLKEKLFKNEEKLICFMKSLKLALISSTLIILSIKLYFYFSVFLRFGIQTDFLPKEYLSREKVYIYFMPNI